MLQLIVLHAATAALAIPVARRFGRGALLVALIAPAATLAWAGWAIVAGARPVQQTVTWLPSLGIEAAFRVDAFSLLMVGLVAGIGALVLVYAWGYTGPSADPGGPAAGKAGRMASLLVAFAGAMLGLVTADDLLLLFVFWELTSVASFLLVGLDDRSATARRAALQALLVTAAGGLALLAGLVLLGQEAGALRLSAIVADPPAATGPVVAGATLVLLGAFTKSAQLPFSSWLPGAMAAPTPVSAYLHSATMVKAGVFLVARLAPALAVVPGWRALTLGVGIITFVWGGWRALRQTDLKLILAYGTVGTLGLLIAMLGVGTPEATFAGVGLLLAHALYKAALFTGAGAIDKATGTRDIARLRGVGARLPVLAGAAVLAGLSMAGVPPLLGFTTKEVGLVAALGLEGAGATGVAGAWLTTAGVVVGSVLTVAYTARLLHGGLAGTPADNADAPDVTRPHATLVAPTVVLAAVSLALGLVSGWANAVVTPAAAVLDPEAADKALVLWPGVNLALALSVVAVAGGVAMFAARGAVQRFGDRVGTDFDAQAAFADGVTAVQRGAGRIAAVVQSGSLLVYLAVALLALLALPGVSLVRAVLLDGGAGEMLDDVVLADSAPQAVAAGVVVVAAIAATVVRGRMASVLLLGVIGYAIAVVFTTRGAPDLALTQFLIESVAVVAFALALWRLPRRFVRAPRVPWRRTIRVALSIGVGCYVALLAVATTGVGSDRMEAADAASRSVGEALVERSLPEAEGRNVVNVTLTDFRALDTLGEITVLLVAGLGLLRLIRARPVDAPSAVGPSSSAAAAADAGSPDRAVHERVVPSRASPAVRAGRAAAIGTVVDALVPLLLAFAAYLLFAGHNAPGGGFVGGLVAGSAFALRALAGRRLVRPATVDDAPAAPPRPSLGVPARLPLAVGLLIALADAVAAMLVGGPVLDQATATLSVPLLGTVKASSTLIFDVGVLLVVVGLIGAVIDGLGATTVATGDVAQPAAPPTSLPEAADQPVGPLGGRS